MTPREELNLILELIKKYNLPLSPILEYAVNEKKDEYPEEETSAPVMSQIREDIVSLSKDIKDDEPDVDPEMIELTREIIEAARTPNGGFTKKQLAAIGISWPAPKDWIERKIGTFISHKQLENFNHIEYVVQKSLKTYSSHSAPSGKKAKNRQELRRTLAILRAITHFENPTTIRNIARTISRTDWGGSVLESDVEVLIKCIPEILNVGNGTYILKEKYHQHNRKSDNVGLQPSVGENKHKQMPNMTKPNNDNYLDERNKFKSFLAKQKSNFNKPYSDSSVKLYSSLLTSAEMRKILTQLAGNPNIFEINDMQIIYNVICHIKDFSDVTFSKGPVISALNLYILYKTDGAFDFEKLRSSIEGNDSKGDCGDDKYMEKRVPGEPTLSVLFPDGRKIKEFYSSQTFNKTLVSIGVDEIYKLDIVTANKFLIVKWNEHFSQNQYQRLDKNNYVCRLDNERRISILREISERLDLNLMVELS